MSKNKQQIYHKQKTHFFLSWFLFGLLNIVVVTAIYLSSTLKKTCQKKVIMKCSSLEMCLKWFSIFTWIHRHKVLCSISSIESDNRNHFNFNALDFVDYKILSLSPCMFDFISFYHFSGNFIQGLIFHCVISFTH